MKQGFRNQKWFPAYRPGNHTEGLKKNVELVANLRETLGDRAEIMFDAFQGWSLDYAINWAKRVEQYRPRWIEEAFQMDRMESFVKLRAATSVPVALGGQAIPGGGRDYRCAGGSGMHERVSQDLPHRFHL